MNKLLITVVLLHCSLLSQLVQAQVKIGSPATPPHASAQLEVQSPNKGLLLPRNANPQASIANPAAGLLAYNQTSNSPQYYNGSSWVDMGNMVREFPRSVHVAAFSVAATHETRIVTLPEGVTRIWVELWSGGSGGSRLGLNPGNPGSYRGGHGGGYLSAILTIANGSPLTVRAGRPGLGAFGSNIASSGYFSDIQQAGAALATVSAGGFALPGDAGLLQFIQGEYGKSTTYQYQTYYSGSTPGSIAFFKGGNGGGSYGAAGGEGELCQTGFNNGTIITTNQNGVGVSGSFPGGGGGVGKDEGGNGGGGLIIIHF